MPKSAAGRPPKYKAPAVQLQHDQLRDRVKECEKLYKDSQEEGKKLVGHVFQMMKTNLFNLWNDFLAQYTTRKEEMNTEFHEYRRTWAEHIAKQKKQYQTAVSDFNHFKHTQRTQPADAETQQISVQTVEDALLGMTDAELRAQMGEVMRQNLKGSMYPSDFIDSQPPDHLT